MLTPPEAQAYLAELMRERIETHTTSEIGDDGFDYEYFYTWIDSKRIVTDREWLEVARMVEDEFTQEQICNYLWKLTLVIGESKPKNKAGFPIVSDFDKLHATYIQKATAMKLARVEKILKG